MKMLLALALLAASAAQASDFQFYANTDGTWQCPSYCVGFTTTDPAHSVDLVNVTTGTVQMIGGAWVQTYNFLVKVDGIEHRGTNTRSPFVADGIAFTVHFTTVKGCTVNRPCTHYHTNDGSVSLP